MRGTLARRRGPRSNRNSILIRCPLPRFTCADTRRKKRRDPGQQDLCKMGIAPRLSTRIDGEVNQRRQIAGKIVKSRWIHRTADPNIFSRSALIFLARFNIDGIKFAKNLFDNIIRSFINNSTKVFIETPCNFQ